jgi:hypothetical protein
MYFILSCCLQGQNVTVKQNWVLPNPGLRFDQTCYLCSHNSFANKDEGFKNAQQKYSLKKQIEEFGVRCFMLDVYSFQGDVYMCHEECGGKGVYKRTGSVPKKVDSAESFFKAVGKVDDLIKDSTKSLKAQFGDDLGYKKFDHALNVISDFLDANPQEVFTIILQNETSSEKVYNVIRKNNRAKKYWLKTDDWDPYVAHEGIPMGGWPTLKELQEKNKRLIIFDSKPSGEEFGMFYQWFYTFENWYNTDDTSKLCGQRTESNISNAKKEADKLIEKYERLVNSIKKSPPKTPAPGASTPWAIFEDRLNRFKNIKNHLEQRQLTVINNFKPGKAGSKANTYKTLTTVFKDCQNKFPKNYPNFIALDHVEEGNPIEFVNMVNKQNTSKA